MKKSTLFFKVMVLLALLVPWTAWGQSQLSEGIDENNVIADKIMVLDSNGEIPGNNSGATEEQKGKNVKLETFHFKTGYDYNDWTFVDEVKPSDSGITVTIQGGNKMLSLSGSPNSGVDAIYIKIKNNNGDEKWARYGFVEDGTIVIENLQIDYSEKKGSKVYDGEAIDADDIKAGLTVSATVGTKTITFAEGEYTITPPTAAVDANEDSGYTFTITITKEGYVGSGTGTYKITKRPITVTVDDSKTLEFELGTTNPSFTASEYLVAKGIDGNAKSGLVTKDEKEETPNFTGNLTFDASSITETGNQTVFLTYEESNIQDNEKTGFKKDNYDITLSLDNVSVTVKPIEIDADDVKGYDDETKKTVIIGSTEDYAVTYDGKAHKIGYVTVTVGDKEIELKNDEYSVEYDNSDSAPIHVKTGDTKTYNVVITITSKNYTLKDGETVEGTIEIKPVTLTVSKKSDVTDLIWNGDDMDLMASKYLEVNGAVNDEEQYISITGNLKNDDTYTGEGYKLVRGDAALKYAEDALETDYTEDWSAVAVGIIVGDGKDPQEDEPITITPGEGSEDESKVLTTSGKNEAVYNGCAWRVEKIGSIDLPDEGATITITKEGEEESTETPIKNVGEYNIHVEYTADGVLHKSDQKFKITPATLTVTVAEQFVEITDMASLTKEALAKELTALTTEGADANVKVEGLKGPDYVSYDDNSLTLADKKEWVLGENAEAITLANDVTITTDDEANYNVTKVAGTLNVTFLINDENKDEFISFAGDGASRIYNGIALGEGEEQEVSLNIPNVTEYEVTYAPKAEGGDEECADAGDYVATITVTIPEGVPYKIDGEGSLTVDYKITKRPLKLQFSFDNDIQEGETLKLGDNVSLEPVEKLDEENMGFAGKEANEFNAWLENGRISATFKVHTEAVDGKYPVELETITFPKEGENLKYSNYDVTYIVMDADLKPSEEEHPLLDADEQTPNEDGDYTHEGDDDDIIGGFEPVDNSGHGTITGTNYRKNRLYLADRDFYFNDLYDEEGLILYSRHDKKYTEDGGSFTIWYEHNGEVNEGGYRIFISSKKNKDYKEVKLDEVSGYYQIRNVNSDVYVKLYYETGFPVANEEITATDVRAYAQANKIVVITPEPTDVQVISMAGAVVATDQVTGQREFANLAEGVYIVCMGETVIKLQVRN